MRVRVADGHVERRAAQQAGHVARVAEVPDDVGPAQQCLGLEAGQRRAEAALWRGAEGSDVEGADHPLQVTGRHGGVSAVGVPAGPISVGEHHDRTRAVAAEGRQDAVGVHRADPGQGRHPLQRGSFGEHVLEEIQAARVRGPAGAPIGSPTDRAGLPSPTARSPLGATPVLEQGRSSGTRATPRVCAMIFSSSQPDGNSVFRPACPVLVPATAAAGPTACTYGLIITSRPSRTARDDPPAGPYEHRARIGIQDRGELRIQARSGLTRGAHRTRSGLNCVPHRYLESSQSVCGARGLQVRRVALVRGAGCGTVVGCGGEHRSPDRNAGAGSGR